MLCTTTTTTAVIPTCPLTFQPIEDPVLVDCPCQASVGREAFAQWVQIHLPETGSGMPLCPGCETQPLRSLELRRDLFVAAAIDEWQNNHHPSSSSSSSNCHHHWNPATVSSSSSSSSLCWNENRVSHHESPVHPVSPPQATKASRLFQKNPSNYFPYQPQQQQQQPQVPQKQPQSPRKAVESKKVVYRPVGRSRSTATTTTSSATPTFPNAFRHERTLTGIGDYVLCCVPLQGGQRLVTGTALGPVKIIDMTSRCEHTLLGHTSWVDCCVVLPDGRRLVTGSRDNTLRVWDLTTGKCLKTLRGHRGRVACCALLGPCRVVSGSDDGTLKIWNVDVGVCEETLRKGGHKGTIFACVVLPAESSNSSNNSQPQRIVSAGRDRTLRVWEAGQCVQTVRDAHSGPISCCAVLDANRVVTGSDDYTLKIWNLSSGRIVCERTLQGHTDWIMGVTVLPSAKQQAIIVSASGDQTLKVWKADHNDCQQTLTGHSWVVACCSALGSDRFVSGSYDCTLRFWSRETPMEE